MKDNIESNKLIAEFMELKLFSDRTPSLEYWWAESEDSVTTYAGTWPFQDPPPFDRNWNYLMPVVEKIEQLRQGDKSYDIVIGFGEYCGIVQYEGRGRKRAVQRWESSQPYRVDHEHGIVEQGTKRPDTKIQAVYSSIIQFITYYNTLNHDQ